MKIEKDYIEIFDGSLPQYGGHWQKLSVLTDLDYLIISKGTFFKKHKCMYYDGYHHGFDFMFLKISWGGRPYKETN